MFCMKCRQINLSRKSVCAQGGVNSLLVGICLFGNVALANQNRFQFFNLGESSSSFMVLEH